MCGNEILAGPFGCSSFLFLFLLRLIFLLRQVGEKASSDAQLVGIKWPTERKWKGKLSLKVKRERERERERSRRKKKEQKRVEPASEIARKRSGRWSVATEMKKEKKTKHDGSCSTSTSTSDLFLLAARRRRRVKSWVSLRVLLSFFFVIVTARKNKNPTPKTPSPVGGHSLVFSNDVTSVSSHWLVTKFGDKSWRPFARLF